MFTTTNDDRHIYVEGAKIAFPNFACRAGMYNDEGKGGFTLLLPNQVADILAADGWYVGQLVPRLGDEPPIPKINVKLSKFGSWPNITIISGDRTHRVFYSKEMAGDIDRMRFASHHTNVFHYRGETYTYTTIPADGSPPTVFPYSMIDLCINPYMKNGKISAWLGGFAGTLVDDPIEAKYADIPIG